MPSTTVNSQYAQMCTLRSADFTFRSNWYHKTSDTILWLLSVQIALTPGLYPGPGVYARPGFYQIMSKSSIFAADALTCTAAIA